MRNAARNRQSGIALFFSVFALLLLSAIAASLVLLATTETTINSNYRSEEVAFFAARSGISEAADRMMSATASVPVITPPVFAPSSAGGVLYVINQGGLSTAVQPWVASTSSSPNIYMDDELCHDGYTLAGMTSTPPDVPCTTLPTGITWYTTVTSNSPWNGTAAALPYQWVRVTMKLNGSVPHLTPGSQGSAPTSTDYYVNPNQPTTTPVCWNGVSEVVMTGATCQAMGGTNVYLLTALAVSPNGARSMVQSEITLNSTPGIGYGLFAKSSACPAITFSGNGTTNSYSTYGYNSSNASLAYAATQQQTDGNLGTNGTVSLSGSALIGGSIAASNANVGNCPAGLSKSGNAGMAQNQVPPNTLTQVVPSTFPTPPAPNPLPPTNNVNYSQSASLAPGSYGNVSVSGNATLTLAPGVYNLNSLNVSGNGTVTISPAGSIVLNLAGTGQNTVLTLSGNGIANPSDIPGNVVVNNAGTGAITISGNGNFYALIDAPNSALTYSGNGNFYGAMVGNTIVDSGNGAVHYDRNSNVSAAQVNGNYITLAFRELPY